jgi:hypothetical protein
MAKRLVDADGNEVKKIAPTLADGRTLVQRVDGGLLDVVDESTLNVEED